MAWTAPSPNQPCHLQLRIPFTTVYAVAFTGPNVKWLGQTWSGGTANKTTIFNFFYDGAGTYYGTWLTEV